MNAIIETEENELPQSHQDILEERLKAHQENIEEGRTWEEVRSSLSYKIIVKTLAEQDTIEAVDRYHTRAAHLAGKFLEEIDYSILILQSTWIFR